jgi:hypothetical protein
MPFHFLVNVLRNLNVVSLRILPSYNLLHSVFTDPICKGQTIQEEAAWLLKLGLIGSPETSVLNHPAQRHNHEDERIQFNRRGNLRSSISFLSFFHVTFLPKCERKSLTAIENNSENYGSVSLNIYIFGYLTKRFCRNACFCSDLVYHAARQLADLNFEI